MKKSTIPVFLSQLLLCGSLIAAPAGAVKRATASSRPALTDPAAEIAAPEAPDAGVRFFSSAAFNRLSSSAGAFTPARRTGCCSPSS